MNIEIVAPKPYDFAASVRDHGWIALAPFGWIADQNAVQRVERLNDGSVVLLIIAAQEIPDHVRIAAQVEGTSRLSATQRREIEQKVHWMLKLDEEFSEFYSLCARDPELAAKVKGRGRLLRSPTFFEDVIKTICTCNTTWTQTKGMIARLVERLGDPLPSSDPARHAFPTPVQIADAGEKIFETDIRLGYRNTYALRLAREVSEGQRNLEALKSSDLPFKELKKALKQIMGVGDYAAHTLLMILGRYDEIAVDSEFRSFVGRKYANGKTLTDKDMLALYSDWGRWKYLVYWFDSSS